MHSKGMWIFNKCFTSERCNLRTVSCEVDSAPHAVAGAVGSAFAELEMKLVFYGGSHVTLKAHLCVTCKCFANEVWYL